MPVARVEVVVFDVNETLSDLAPMGDRFVEVGAPAWAAKVWFASLLRDGFALAAAGTAAPFAEIGRGTLRAVLAGTGTDRDPDAAVEHVMAGFLDLPVHPDVVDGVTRLAATGVRLVTLTNGAAEVGDRLLSAAGIRDHFERLMSVVDAGVWKPAPGSYAYAARTCGVDPEAMLLVAVHPWDVDGAKRAGLRAAWVERAGAPYPGHFLRPDVTVAGIGEVADALG
ncbi:MAG TPA: haloacid dehalogenase type II [Acidimicrobiales bacterium]|nr:haloacid dehalogenase type II [Acidimicrobiales bacterium]